MSRVVIRQAFGGPGALEVREIAEPHAGPDEIRIAVRAAGLNPLDWQISASPGHLNGATVLGTASSTALRTGANGRRGPNVSTIAVVAPMYH